MKTNGKQLATVLLTLIMTVTLMTALALPAAAATSGTCGDNLTWTLDDINTLTISGTGAMENYKYGKSPWFNARENIERVVIGNSVTKIGNYAFYGCRSLTEVVIPASVMLIEYGAFSSCDSLTEVVIPAGVMLIEGGAFNSCRSLTAVTVDQNNSQYESEGGVLFDKKKQHW